MPGSSWIFGFGTNHGLSVKQCRYTKSFAKDGGFCCDKVKTGKFRGSEVRIPKNI